MGKTYRRLTEDEVLQLKSQSCLADDWNKVAVAEEFTTEFVHHTRFSGDWECSIRILSCRVESKNIPA